MLAPLLAFSPPSVIIVPTSQRSRNAAERGQACVLGNWGLFGSSERVDAILQAFGQRSQREDRQKILSSKTQWSTDETQDGGARRFDCFHQGKPFSVLTREIRTLEGKPLTLGFIFHDLLKVLFECNICKLDCSYLMSTT